MVQAFLIFVVKLSTSTSLYFPTDKSETVALSFMSLLSLLPCLCRLVLQRLHLLTCLLLSLSIFVISTEPFSNCSFSTFNDKTSVIPFLISNDTGSWLFVA